MQRLSEIHRLLQDLVGRIADRGAEFVPAREWMRICFELLEMLKAHKKGIRRATVNTFGYIAKAIGPQDVLVTLLNNLKVQERQNRVCTTVAIAIVAETCSPFTVLPALMNEYKVCISSGFSLFAYFGRAPLCRHRIPCYSSCIYPDYANDELGNLQKLSNSLLKCARIRAQHHNMSRI